MTFYALEAIGRAQGVVSRSRVRVERNLAYLDTGRRSHLLDVYVPEGRVGPLPVVVYVHGGAFMWCSKETHMIFAHAWARAGFIVFNLNYRLAPRHMYPAAIEDVCAALRWAHVHAARFGGDPGRIVLAGESAGANLVSAVTIACCSKRPESWAKAMFESGIVPRVVVASCGILQVSDVHRFSARRALPRVVRRVLHMLPDGYVDLNAPRGAGELDLLDPVSVFESEYHFERTVPPFFLSAGTADPLLDDSRRLAQALARRAIPCDARYYPGEIHAFHVMLWREQARQYWRDVFRFVDGELRDGRSIVPNRPDPDQASDTAEDES
jgi:acetyl esterase